MTQGNPFNSNEELFPIMEMRGVGAISIIALLLLGSTLAVNEAFASKDPRAIGTHPPIHIKKSGSPSPVGLSPLQIGHAYGFDLLSCYGTSSCGSGQTIAIVDPYDDPNIESDLATFSAQYGLPPCTTANGCFTKATPQGLPNSDTVWALEESLDVEWAHAMAPGAKIILVEAQDSLLGSLLSAVDYAASQPNVNQVSMSWVANEFPGESFSDYHFNVAGVSFIASSGDSGTGVAYPAASPYVVSVGGTTLNVDGSGNVQSETAWSGSGGGVSSQESAQSYQTDFNSNSGRGVPDVSYDGDPNTGVSIYDSFGSTEGWNQVGGTSVGAPQWAAITAIVNSGGGQLSSASFGTNTAFYNAATGPAYSANYRDITSGNNGNCGTICNAGPSYDFVTGLGSPLTNNLIPYLQPPDFTITANPSSLTINSGSSGSSTITVTSINGFSGTVSLSSSTGSSLDVSSLTVGSGGTATATLTITNPASSGTYTVTGTSGTLTHSADVTVTVLTVPSTPQNLQTTSGNAQVSLSWSAPSNNGGSAITSYNIYRSTSSGTETLLATIGNVLSYTDTAVTNGQTYFYKVTAVNSVGESSQSNEAGATPAAIPSAPQNLVAFPGNAKVGLTWSAPSSNGGSAITGYGVYRGTLPGGEGTTPIATITGTSYTDSGLTNGQTYYYKVTAINSVGESSSSNEASATPQLPALSVSVTTDKPVYSKGSASITVTVTNSTSAPISGASVTLTVKAPNGNTSQSTGTTINGQVTFSYHLTKPGTYTASATANKSGYLSGSGSTTFIET